MKTYIHLKALTALAFLVFAVAITGCGDSDETTGLGTTTLLPTTTRSSTGTTNGLVTDQLSQFQFVLSTNEYSMRDFYKGNIYNIEGDVKLYFAVTPVSDWAGTQLDARFGLYFTHDLGRTAFIMAPPTGVLGTWSNGQLDVIFADSVGAVRVKGYSNGNHYLSATVYYRNYEYSTPSYSGKPTPPTPPGSSQQYVSIKSVWEEYTDPLKHAEVRTLGTFTADMDKVLKR